MTTTVQLPHPKDVRDMFEGLLGRGVDVAPGQPVTPSQAQWAAVGAYADQAAVGELAQFQLFVPHPALMQVAFVQSGATTKNVPPGVEHQHQTRKQP